MNSPGGAIDRPRAIRRLDTRSPEFKAEFAALSAGSMASLPEVERGVREIIEAVRQRGDDALVEFAARFDGVDCAAVADLALGRSALRDAWRSLAGAQRQALEEAAQRIERYHRAQLRAPWSYTDDLGNELGQRVTPLDRVGVYVPGGQAAYPSTVLMTMLPAAVAGVTDIVAVMPCADAPNPLALAALHRADAGEVYALGGAHAVAALAFGTESIRPVDKIVGPGGAWVTEAKRQVFGQTGIDLIAGPSEILIVADGTAPVDWMVYDLFSQAEHDVLAQSLLLCPDGDYLDRIAQRLEALLPDMARRDIIARSLADRGALIRTRSLAEAVDLANAAAPEHLELAVADPQPLLDQVRHAGAIFLGHHVPEVMGDYVAGPSHVLPTYGTARFSSPLGVDDFQKRSSVIALSSEGASALAQTASVLARGEGLEAHALAAEARR